MPELKISPAQQRVLETLSNGWELWHSGEATWCASQVEGRSFPVQARVAASLKQARYLRLVRVFDHAWQVFLINGRGRTALRGSTDV